MLMSHFGRVKSGQWKARKGYKLANLYRFQLYPETYYRADITDIKGQFILETIKLSLLTSYI